MTSEGRKPPSQRKQRSAGLIQTPEMRWKTSPLMAPSLMAATSSWCARQLSTYTCSSPSGSCCCSAARSSYISRWCSSCHLPYSTSNIAASELSPPPPPPPTPSIPPSRTPFPPPPSPISPPLPGKNTPCTMYRSVHIFIHNT
uniref:Uncharacterized protein n=2 Tax=Oryza TaxID=4527 RepID=A0A0D3H8C4_9ORYZ